MLGEREMIGQYQQRRLLTWKLTPHGGHVARLGHDIVGSVGKRRYFEGDPRSSDDEPFTYTRTMMIPEGWRRSGECASLEKAMEAVERGVMVWMDQAGFTSKEALIAKWRDEYKATEQLREELDATAIWYRNTRREYLELSDALGCERGTSQEGNFSMHDEILARAREAGRALKMVRAMDADEFWQKLSDDLDDHLDDYGYLHYAANAEDRARIAAFLRRRVEAMLSPAEPAPAEPAPAERSPAEPGSDTLPDPERVSALLMNSDQQVYAFLGIAYEQAQVETNLNEVVA
jgi:hypothetical protein